MPYYFFYFSEFCDYKNEGLDISPEEVPQGESFDFVLIPARPEADSENAEQATGEAIPEKKESKGMVVYCMDISGSMGCTVRLPELQGIECVNKVFKFYVLFSSPEHKVLKMSYCLSVKVC